MKILDTLNDSTSTV